MKTGRQAAVAAVRRFGSPGFLRELGDRAARENLETVGARRA